MFIFLDRICCSLYDSVLRELVTKYTFPCEFPGSFCFLLEKCAISLSNSNFSISRSFSLVLKFKIPYEKIKKKMFSLFCYWKNNCTPKRTHAATAACIKLHLKQDGTSEIISLQQRSNAPTNLNQQNVSRLTAKSSKLPVVVFSKLFVLLRKQEKWSSNIACTDEVGGSIRMVWLWWRVVVCVCHPFHDATAFLV